MVYKDLDRAGVENLGFELAMMLKNKKALVGLMGTLGAGKTTFVKAFAKKFKIKKIKSPTFVIAHQYKIGDKFLYHMDFYRLQDKKQLTDLGLDEIFNGDNLVLIEWVDRFDQIKKKCDILISFKVRKNDKRDVTIQTI